MTQWYEKLGAQIGLRVAGLALFVLAWFECGLLRGLVMGNPAADMTGAEFLLAALMFLSASAGVALAIVGGGLWRPVKISERWVEALVVSESPNPKHGSPIGPGRAVGRPEREGGAAGRS